LLQELLIVVVVLIHVTPQLFMAGTLSALTSLMNNFVLLRICLSESGYNFLF